MVAVKRKRSGLDVRGKRLKAQQAVAAPIEDLTEEQLVDLIETDAEPFMNLRNAAKDVGLEPQLVERMIARVRAQYQPVLTEMKTVKTHELLDLLEDRAHRALSYLDDYALAKAGAKDLAIIAGIMMEKRALLRGEPTHIMGTAERESLNDLVPLLVAEAEKRGVTYHVMDAEGEEVTAMTDVTPPSMERQARKRSGGRSKITDANRRVTARAKAESGEP